MKAPSQEALQQRVMERLTDQMVNDFQRDGAICIRQLLTPEEVALLREGIDANIPQFGRFIAETPLALASARLMGSPSVRLYHDHVLVKEPGTRQRTPWHQDQPYYNIEGQQNISMWIPVDPVSRSATLEFIAGSHKGPWLMPRTFMDNQAKWFPDGSLADLPDVEAARDQFPIVGWDIEPGDLVCFHMLTLHAAGGVEGSNRRRVFSVRFMGDDTRHAPRRWATSPDFPGLEAELPAGATMAHPLFPLMAT